jgi:hypothetical protein
MCTTCKPALKIELGKFYKTRDGRKVSIVSVTGDPRDSLPGLMPVRGFIAGRAYDRGEFSGDYFRLGNYWSQDGRYSTYGESPEDLVAEWREPVKKDAYVYLYRSAYGSEITGAMDARPSKRCGSLDLIACQKITLREGEGLHLAI